MSTPPSDSSPNGPRPTDWRQSLREAGPYMGLGLQLAVSMAFFVGAGYAADQWLGSMPWMTIAGSVLGMVAVFVQIFRTSGELSKDSAARKRAEERTARERSQGPGR